LQSYSSLNIAQVNLLCAAWVADLQNLSQQLIAAMKTAAATVACLVVMITFCVASIESSVYEQTVAIGGLGVPLSRQDRQYNHIGLVERAMPAHKPVINC